MHTNTLTLLAALTALAVPAAGLPGSYDRYEDTQAPVGAHLKDVGNIALAACQLLDPGLPFSCDPNPGAIPALGGAFFDVTAWNNEAGAAASYGRAVRVNVQQFDGTVAGGFAAFACTSYNDDPECDSGSFGYADDDCASGKDNKSCDNPLDLELVFCAEKDDHDFLLVHDDGTITTEHDGAYDDLVVFVEAWADVADSDAGGTGLLANPRDNTGYGLSSGTFRVYADWSGQAGFLDQTDCDALNDVVVAH